MRDTLRWAVWFAGRLFADLRPDEETGELWALLFDQCGLLIGVGIGMLIAAAVIGLVRRGGQGRLESYEVALQQSNQTLEEVRTSLGAQASAETSELRRRFERLRAVASLGHDLSSARDINALMTAATSLVADRFGVHHAGLYLLDGEASLPRLRGASSEAAKGLVDSGRELAVATEGGLVAAVAQRHEPLVAHLGDLRSEMHDPHWLDGTQSRLAVPLWLHDRVTGVLDLQSQEPDLFDDDDIGALEVAAEQVALAVQCVSWVPTKLPAPDVRAGPCDASEDVRTKDSTTLPDVEVTLDGQLVVPILLRGQVIGMMVLERDGVEQPWAAEERDLARAMGAQAGLALERARFLGALRSSTRREQLLRDLSGRLRATERADDLVRVALGEISEALNLSAVDFWMKVPALPVPWAYRATDGVVQPWPGPVDARVREAWERDEVMIHREEAFSAVAIPLRSEGRAVGAMCFERPVEVGVWLDEEIALLSASADLLLGALDRAGALSEAREAAERDQALRDVLHLIRQGSGVEAVIQTAVSETRQAMGLHSVSVRLAQHDIGSVGDAAGQGFEVGPTGLRSLGPLPLEEWSPDLQQACRTQQPVAGQLETVDGSLLCHLALPVPGFSDVLGILDVARPVDRGDWTSAEQRALEWVAEELGQALEGIGYREAMGLRLAQAHDAAEVPGRLYASLDVDTVLRTAVRELQALLGLQAAEVRIGPVTPVSGTADGQSDHPLEPDGQRKYENG